MSSALRFSSWSAPPAIRGWDYWQEKQAQATGDRFLAALDLANKGKHEEAIAALKAIEANGSGRYPVLAGFRVASEMAATGDNTRCARRI